jgi:hypothetical protein
VADDLVQPSPEVLDLRPRLQRRERAQERLLDDVLRPPVGAQTPGVGVELVAVALDDHRERPLVPGAGQADQPLVGLRAEEQIGEPRAYAWFRRRKLE